MATVWITTHEDGAPTPAGLRKALLAMRWEDVERFAYELEASRSGFASSRRKLSSGDVITAARAITEPAPSPALSGGE